MPKTKTRKRRTRGSGAAQAVPTTSNTHSTVVQADASASQGENRARSPSRPAARSRTRGGEALMMPIMVALGCWGMAISFVFFFPEPNHYLYGAMAALMGILWSLIVGIRITRMRKPLRHWTR